MGDKEQALTLFHRSIALNPNDVYAYYNEGFVLQKMGNFTGAILAYNQALKLTPHNDDTLYNKALALIGVAIQKEKPFETLREALKCFDNVLAINPQDKNAAYFKTLLIQIITKYAPNMMTSGTR